jgi:hypothetical protein
MYDSDAFDTDAFSEDAFDFGGGDVPGQEGELNAASRVVRSHGVMALVRRTALALALLLLGAL